MCRAQCSWALVWSFSVRTNSVSLLQRTAGTKTTGLWPLQQTLLTLLTWRKEPWWEKTTDLWNTPPHPHPHYLCRVLFSLIYAFCLCLEQKLNSVSKSDSGLYRCESSNSVGAPKSCVAQQLEVIDCKWFNATLQWWLHVMFPWPINDRPLLLHVLLDPLNMATLILGAAAFVAFVLICCICVCVCRRRGCCKSE